MQPTDKRQLDVLYEEIGERARAIAAERPWWPCAEDWFAAAELDGPRGRGPGQR